MKKTIPSASPAAVGYWNRITPFKYTNPQTEIWLYQDKKKTLSYKVETTLGKPIDILALKSNMVSNYGLKVKQMQNSRKKLFKKERLEHITHCPICKNKAKGLPAIFKVYGAEYIQCQNCTHCFVKNRLTDESLKKFYAQDTAYQSTYADPKTTETRLKQVALPKAEWVIKQFQKIYGRKPKGILDIGAGSGHFVKACKNLGLRAEGLELSRNGKDFCKQNFGFELLNQDFLNTKVPLKNYEIITFWGLIEHVPEPMQMLKKAASLLKGKKGLVISSVPNWYSFSTAVQKAFSASIIRHLEPLAHINCFTDSSLATAYLKNGLYPAAAWYFGMDAYELVTQTAYFLKNNSILDKMSPTLPIWQACFDQARLSDELVLAGKTKLL